MSTSDSLSFAFGQNNCSFAGQAGPTTLVSRRCGTPRTARYRTRGADTRCYRSSFCSCTWPSESQHTLSVSATLAVRQTFLDKTTPCALRFHLGWLSYEALITNDPLHLLPTCCTPLLRHHAPQRCKSRHTRRCKSQRERRAGRRPRVRSPCINTTYNPFLPRTWGCSRGYRCPYHITHAQKKRTKVASYAHETIHTHPHRASHLLRGRPGAPGQPRHVVTSRQGPRVEVLAHE